MHTLKYSDTELIVPLPEAQISADVESNQLDLPKRTLQELVTEALNHPIGSNRWKRLYAREKPCASLSLILRAAGSTWSGICLFRWTG